MKFLNVLTLASVASAAPSFDILGSPAPLSVELKMVGNSQVKASITNKSNARLKLLRTGSILDSSPVEKVQIVQNGKQIEFSGVHMSIAYDMLKESAFKNLDAGETVQVTFDVAQHHDLSRGGKFDISSIGSIAYANGNSTKLAGELEFQSNKILAEIDGVVASLSHIVLDHKRTTIQPDCTDTDLASLRAALRNCAYLAQAATQAAIYGPDTRMLTFYEAADAATRGVVAAVFEKVKNECLSYNSGVSALYCTDKFNACADGVLAYTVAAASYMVYCPLFFSALPLSSQSCYGQSKANTIVHECTHLSQVKGTNDFGGYGFSSVQSLTAAQNLNHADTYALFAQSVYAKC